MAEIPRSNRGSEFPELPVAAQSADASRFCPNCGSEMRDSRCKLACPSCGFFLSCSDFY